MTEVNEAPIQRGVLIALEGADYVGKSTQRELLAERLRAEGYDVLLTREVGGTPFAERIRELMFRRPVDCEPVSPLAEMLLAYAARTQHIEQVIMPALAAGKVVLTDRWVTSTFCYQVWPHINGNMQHGLLNVFVGLNGSVLSGVITEEPLVLILDVTDETRAARHALNNNPDAMEQRDAVFHASVVEAYRQHESAPNHEIIDANRTPKEIADDLYKHFVAYYGATMDMRLIVANNLAQAAAGQRPAPEGGMDDMPPELRALAEQIQKHGGHEAPDHSFATAQANGFPGTEADWVAHLTNMQQVELHQQATGVNPLQQATAEVIELIRQYDADPSQLTADQRAYVENMRVRAKQAMGEMSATGAAMVAELEAKTADATGVELVDGEAAKAE